MMNFLKNKKDVVVVVATLSVLLVFFIIRLVFGVNAAKKSSGEFRSLAIENSNSPSKWEIAEFREAEKEIYWLEQQLAIAKNDSISLAVNLADSILMIQLQGMDLFHSRILKQHPENFLNSVTRETYFQLAKVTEIRSEYANVPKKPIKKVKAPKNGVPQPEPKKDKVPNPELIWRFTTNNNIRIVITGVKMTPDSVFRMHARTDLTKHKAQEFFTGIIPSGYAPTVYLWLSDSDAKAIYRAVPEKGKMLFRN